MKTLFLAWQDQVGTRAWYPIGRLDADQERSNYRFGYTRGAEIAHEQAGLEPLDSFPDFHRSYESSELFPLFRNRIISSERQDFQEYCVGSIVPRSGRPTGYFWLSTGGERQTTISKFFQELNGTGTTAFDAVSFCTAGGMSTKPRKRNS